MVSDIKDDLISPDDFESVLSGVVSYAIRGTTVNPHKIGNAFRAKEGTRFGRDGLYLQRACEFRRAILWTVCSAVSPTPCEFDEFGEFPTLACARESVFSTPATIKKDSPIETGVEQTLKTLITHTEHELDDEPSYEEF